jgi:hypothetical protein
LCEGVGSTINDLPVRSPSAVYKAFIRVNKAITKAIKTSSGLRPRLFASAFLMGRDLAMATARHSLAFVLIVLAFLAMAAPWSDSPASALGPIVINEVDSNGASQATGWSS